MIGTLVAQGATLLAYSVSLAAASNVIKKTTANSCAKKIDAKITKAKEDGTFTPELEEKIITDENKKRIITYSLATAGAGIGLGAVTAGALVCIDNIGNKPEATVAALPDNTEADVQVVEI